MSLETLKYLEGIIKQYGIVAILILVLILFIHNPDRAEKLKEMLLYPFFRFLKWGRKQYVATKVANSSTEFLKRNLSPYLNFVNSFKVKVKWVSSASDPVLKNDGTLILRLENTNDQTRNVLAATQVALPHVVCPAIRTNIDTAEKSAVDLAVLRKLAGTLGTHAKQTFQRHFLDPEVEGNQRVGELFGKLVNLDKQGVFLSIFLEELNCLGDRLYTLGNTSNKSKEFEAFLEYLLVVVNRDIGEEVPLQYLSPDIRVSIILLAKSAKVDLKGVGPYVQALDVNVKRGCDRIYVIAYDNQRKFLKRLRAVLDGDQRINHEKCSVIEIEPSEEYSFSEKREIALYSRNPLFFDNSFEEKLNALAFKVGDVTKGTVIDVSQGVAYVDVQGLPGILFKRECGWISIYDCNSVVSVNDKIDVVIKDIEADKGRLVLSLRFRDQDPWVLGTVPAESEKIIVKIVGLNGGAFISEHDKTTEVCIPYSEVSWIDDSSFNAQDFIGKEQEVVVYERDVEHQTIKGSIKRLEENPWPHIHANNPRGTEYSGQVVEVTSDHVKVNIGNGLFGFIFSEDMVKGGYEYENFVENVIPGQGLDVVADKVFIKRKKIRLNLKRTS